MAVNFYKIRGTQYSVVAWIMMERSINPYEYGDKPESQWHCCISPLVDSCISVVGWAVPTFDR